MKHLSTAILAALTLSTFAASASTGETKTFNCMDKKTFAINSDCMSQDIESTLVFKNAEKAIVAKANNTSDMALATVTFDEQAMTITVVAHKDATIAKVKTKS